MGSSQIVRPRLHAIRGPLKAVSLVAVRSRSDWAATLHVRHTGPSGRDGYPWQPTDRWLLPGHGVSDHEGALALIAYLAGERSLPGIG